MILLNDFSESFKNNLKEICKASPFGARIISYYNSYSGRKYNFLDFWIQLDNDGKAVCAFCRYYSSLIICGEFFNCAEVNNFIKMISPSAVLCSDNFDLNINKKFSSGEIMLCTDIKQIFTNNYKITKTGSNMSLLKKVYTLLLESGFNEKSLPPFEDYFLDISQFIRHGCAQGYVVLDESENVISTAAVTAMSDDSALIGCVATECSNRRRGLASELVGRITQELLYEGKKVFLQRERKIEIYERLGFKPFGRWKEYF